MLRIILSALLVGAGATYAQAATVTCEDGRVLTTSPFNQNPCGTPAPTAPPEPSTESPTPGPTTPPPEPTAPPPTPTTAPKPTGAVTCADGRVLLPTPFNPNPCGAVGPAPPATPPPTAGPPATEPPVANPVNPAVDSAVPDDFLLAFGGAPEKTGVAFEDTIAEAVYERQFMRFVGLGYEPERFSEVAAIYSRWGLGDPTFYSDRDGRQVRWPEAPYYPAQASVLDAVSRAEAVAATWQTQVVLRGGVLEELHPGVPNVVRALNSGAAPQEDGVTVETFGAGNRASAVFENRPEIAAYWGSLAGLLTRPASPGDRVRVFARGFSDGAIPGVRLGGRELPLGSFSHEQVGPGRIAISLEIPADTASGALAVIVTAAGVSTPAGPYLSVAR